MVQMKMEWKWILFIERYVHPFISSDVQSSIIGKSTCSSILA